jgi:PleD family two-component response regulator
MTSKIGIRVTLRNLQAMRERLGREATDHLLEGIGTFLQKRLRGTDHLERDPGGEFYLSIRNADSACLPALQRRFSAIALESHFSKSANCALEFNVEAEALASLGATASEETLDQAMYTTSGQLAYRR